MGKKRPDWFCDREERPDWFCGGKGRPDWFCDGEERLDWFCDGEERLVEGNGRWSFLFFKHLNNKYNSMLHQESS